MRIVVVAHAYPRWDGDIAGAFLERLHAAMLERSHRMTVVVPADEGHGGSVERNHIPILRVRYAPASLETLAYRGTMTDAADTLPGRLAFGSMIVAQAAAAFDLVRRTQADLIHAHWWVPGGISALLAGLASHRPYVVTLHGTDVAILRRSRQARFMARLVLRKAAAVTAVSRFLADEAAALAGIDSHNISAQPMPLDLTRYARSSRGGNGVVTVGRLVRQKNIPVLLEAIAALRQRGKTVKLKVVGDGPERTALEHRARHLNIAAQTKFVGAVAPEAIPEAIGDADVFVFPALSEGLGLAAAEAFMLGVPVIAAMQGGGVKDIVPARGPGRLVDATNARAVAQAIDEMISDPNSMALARDWGWNLRAKFSPSAAAAVFENIYERALAD